MVEITLGDAVAAAAGIASIFNPAIGAGIGIVGGLIGGSTPSVQGITAAQQASLSGGFGGPVTSGGTSVGPQIDLFPQPIDAGFGTGVARVAQALPRLAPPISPFLSAPGREVARVPLGPAPPAGGKLPTKRQAILSQARFFSPGATAKKIIRSAKECGIELSAATFGLTVLQVCFLIAQPPTRRSRGISAADMRRTRSTIRKVTNIQRDLKQLSGPIRRRS